jgi:hypothetical protein
MESQYFCNVVLGKTRRVVPSIPGEIGREDMMIHLDNCRVPNSRRLPHPPESPDISPCNFWFVGWSNGTLRGAEFQAPGEVWTFLLELWQNFSWVYSYFGLR